MSSISRDRHLEIIDAALLGAKIVKDASECAPVLAPLKGVAGIVITILETVRDMKTNKEDWITLVENLSIQIKGMQDNLSRCPTPHSTSLLLAVNSYEQKLRNVLSNVRLASARGPAGGIFRHRTDKEEILQFNRDLKICWNDFIREISIQTHETVYRVEKDVNKVEKSVNQVEKDVHRIKHGVNRVEMSMDTMGDESQISKLTPVPGATGEDHDICLYGTRAAVLGPIRQWANDPTTPQVRWLTDVAGAGKSTIAKHLSTEWKEQGRLAGCFFFDKNRPDATNKTGFCDTIAAQLANNQPQLRSLITQGIKEIGPILSVCPFEEKLQKLVIRPMETVSLVLVVDALDECNERDRIIILHNLLPCLSQAPQLKVLITSRPERDIVQLLDPYRSRTESLHDIELKSNRNDIAAFVKYKMRGLVQSSELTNEEVDRLARRVNCLFILASTACRVVEDSPNPHVAVEELLNPNQDLLRDINTLYSTVLTKACKANQSGQSSTSKTRELLRVLKAILAASTPLTVSTIDSLLGIKNTRRLVGSLSSILNVRADEVVLILHPTFREFLEDPGVAGLFYVDMTDAHTLMAKGCLAIMKRELCFNICQLESSFTFNKDVPDLDERISKYISKELQYGCISWLDHIVNSGGTSRDKEVDVALLRITKVGYPLFWIEVVSALGKIPKAIKGLQDVGRCHLEKRLKAAINDIKRFLIAFSTPISESIPHIYISAIPFTPKQSYIRQAAESLFPNTMSIVIGCLENWPQPPRKWIGHTSSVISITFSFDGRRIASGSSDETIRLWDAETGQALGEPLRGHKGAVRSVAFSPDGRRVASGSEDVTIRLWDAETGQALGEPLRGHEYAVYSVAFSPDSRRVASGSDDETIRLWDAETGQALGEPLRGHEGGVYSVAFSPDGRCVASGSWDKTIRLWDAETGQALGEPLRGHKGAVRSVAFSPDSRRVASGSEDVTIRLWDAETGQALGEPLRGHEDAVYSVAFSPDSRRVASGSDDETIRLWDAETGQALGEPLRGHEGGVYSVAFSPDGRCVASGSRDKTIRLWDAETGQALGEPLRGHKGAVRSVAFSPDCRRVASGSEDVTIRLWDAETGQALGEPLRGHKGAVRSVAFSPDGRRVASGSWDKTIRLWDAGTGQALGEPLRGHEDAVNSVVFSPDGRHIASGSKDKTIRLWDAETGQALGEPLRGHEYAVYSVVFSPDGRRVASGSGDKTIRLWDAETGQALGKPLRGHEHAVCSVAFSPDGRCVASGSWDKTIRLWDAKTGQALGEPLRGHENGVSSVAFSPDGCRVASGSSDKTIRLWDAETGQALGEPLRGHKVAVCSVAFSADGRRVVSSSWDVTTRLWDAETGQALGEPLRGHKGADRSVALSPDGRRVASGSEGNTIRLWDAGTGQALGESLRGHEYAVHSVGFSPDGRCVASGSRDNTIRLWDAETGQTLGEPLRGHGGAVISVAFSPDGRRVASGSDDKTIRLWSAEPGQPLAQPSRGVTDLVISVPIPSDSHLLAFISHQKPNLHNKISHIPRSVSGPHFAPPYFHHCSLLANGWVSSLEGLLYWVPPHNRHGLQHSHLLTIPTNHPLRTTWIDFTRFRCGTSWIHCRK
ncbi:hypothetical protein FRC18_009893 [Serendipita sp. 400]|nr:hypothetical protein FRC18_009893 [Serendipita sp. 400]